MAGSSTTPSEIWQATLACCRAVLKGVAAKDVAAIGITNQRETSVVWDRATGAPLHNAIVWQDRRTAERCRELKAKGLEEKVAAKTGLLLDPYFSATKLRLACSITFRARGRARNAASFASARSIAG